MRTWNYCSPRPGCKRADLRREGPLAESDPNMYEVMHYAAATGVLWIFSFYYDACIPAMPSRAPGRCRRRLIHFEFRWPSLQKAKTEQSRARARQMLAEAQATRDNGTSCSYIGHNSSREMSDILTSVKKKKKDYIRRLTKAPRRNSW